MLSWENITVQQYQDIYGYCEDSSLSPAERGDLCICALFNTTMRQLEDCPVDRYNKMAAAVKSILETEKIPGKPVRYIKANGRKYYLELNPAKLIKSMKQRQYVECMHFAQKPIENLHMFLASVARPVKYGFILKVNKASDHEKINEDLLQARFIDAYHTCVFFCKLYANSIIAIKDYLKQELTKTGKMSHTDLVILETSLQNAMDGYIQPTR